MKGSCCGNVVGVSSKGNWWDVIVVESDARNGKVSANRTNSA